MMGNLSRIVTVIFVALLFLFLLPGVLDYAYVHYVLGIWEDGISELEWTNPHVAKMSVAILAALYFRFASPTAEFIPQRFVRPIVFTNLLFFALHAIQAVATWNYYFDAKGQATKFYCIDNDNRPHFFAVQRHNPWTNDLLTEISPNDVNDIEARRREPFHEVLNPKHNEWFWPGNAKPRLWYSRSSDGLHLFNAPAADDGGGSPVLPVNSSIRAEWYSLHDKSSSGDSRPPSAM